jgi:pimeloyl-ACP methyl ester carboxylesterase
VQKERAMKIETNGVSISVQDSGSGPAVLLLHGFPDSGYLWRHQVPALNAAGLRTIVPDLRGFGESDRPSDVADYALPNVIGAVLGVLDVLHVAQVHVVGHDRGAAVAWALGAIQPQRVKGLLALTVGHPSGFFADPIGQRERS